MLDCAHYKDKASSIFEPLQFGVACSQGTIIAVHSLRQCIDEHWGDEDFVVLKADIRNAFNLISRQALLSGRSMFSQNSYGQVGVMVHILICGTPQDTSLQRHIRPFCFLLCFCTRSLPLLMQMMNAFDDGVLAGPKQAVLHALSIIEDLGPSL